MTPRVVAEIESPAIEVPLALCTSDHLPSSEPAQAVRAVILQLVDAFATDAEGTADTRKP